MVSLGLLNSVYDGGEYNVGLVVVGLFGGNYMVKPVLMLLTVLILYQYTLLKNAL